MRSKFETCMDILRVLRYNHDPMRRSRLMYACNIPPARWSMFVQMLIQSGLIERCLLKLDITSKGIDWLNRAESLLAEVRIPTVSDVDIKGNFFD